MLDDQMKNFVRAAMANPATSDEVERLLDLVVSLQTSVNALLDELEARRDASESVAASADGFYEGLKL